MAGLTVKSRYDKYRLMVPFCTPQWYIRLVCSRQGYFGWTASGQNIIRGSSKLALKGHQSVPQRYNWVYKIRQIDVYEFTSLNKMKVVLTTPFSLGEENTKSKASLYVRTLSKEKQKNLI